MAAPSAANAPASGRWYRQPVLWLGALLLAGSLGGCLWMIVLGARYADEALPTGGQIFKVPTAQPAPPEPVPR